MLAHYKKGFTKFFSRVATLTHGVPIKCRKYGLNRNNNCIERDHQYSRKLEKNARGNKDKENKKMDTKGKDVENTSRKSEDKIRIGREISTA
ncbi:hypothetical protein HZC30_04735 [Candidatus Woesearchaeota archaeon]|nr:hypothetical protein [Candidatus Woesearchaeota archaeon]